MDSDTSALPIFADRLYASRCDAVISCLAQRLGERLDGGVDYRFIEARIAEN